MPSTTFLATSIDCDDASRSAAFYAGLLGWAVTFDADGTAAVEGDGHTLYFADLPGYTAPGWPSDAKQFHLDLGAPDLDAAAAEVVALGGRVADEQPGGERWTVFLDPAGHPFCISRR